MMFEESLKIRLKTEILLKELSFFSTVIFRRLSIRVVDSKTIRRRFRVPTLDFCSDFFDHFDCQDLSIEMFIIIFC